MIGPSTWLRYWSARFEYAYSFARKFYWQTRLTKYEEQHIVNDPVAWKTYQQRKLKLSEALGIMWKNLFHVDRLTFLHWIKGEQMPLLGRTGASLLVRRIPEPSPTTLRIGDVVVHKDPTNWDNLLVRRIVALEGSEMIFSDENDIQREFDLIKDLCWVEADNKELHFEEAHDSRSFGPLCVPYIVGRAIYSLRSAKDHGPVNNSPLSIERDSVVLKVELDIDEMTKHLKA